MIAAVGPPEFASKTETFPIPLAIKTSPKRKRPTVAPVFDTILADPSILLSAPPWGLFEVPADKLKEV